MGNKQQLQMQPRLSTNSELGAITAIILNLGRTGPTAETYKLFKHHPGSKLFFTKPKSILDHDYFQIYYAVHQRGAEIASMVQKYKSKAEKISLKTNDDAMKIVIFELKCCKIENLRHDWFKMIKENHFWIAKIK
eukprot:UN04885